MKCPYCNQEIDDDSKLCTLCGRELVNTEPVTDSVEDTGSKTETSEIDVVEAEVSQESEVSEPEAVLDPEVSVPEAAQEVETFVPEPAAPESMPSVPEIVPEEKPVKNGKKALVIAAILAAVGVASVSAAMLLPKANPKDAVIDAFKSITAEGQPQPAEDIFGWNAMYTKMMTESSEMNLEFQLQDSSNAMIRQMATGKIGITSMNSMADQKSSFTLGIGYGNMNLTNLETYLDAKQFAIAIPELSSKSFTINYADDLEGQLTNSPYLGKILADSGMDLEKFGSYTSQVRELSYSKNQLFDMKELWNRYKEGSKAIDNLKAAMTAEKAEKKNVTIEGKEVSCKGYNVTITKDALVDFATVSKEFLLSDETLKKDFVNYVKLMLEMQSMMNSLSTNDNFGTPESMQEEMWSDAEAQLNVVIEQMKESMGDVNLVVYVTKNGKMASFDYDTTVTVEEEELKIYGTVDFAGGYQMLANVNATMNLEHATGEKITLAVDRQGQYEKNKSLTDTLTASMTNGAETYALDYDESFAVDTGDYTLTMNLSANGQKAGTMSIDGLIQDIVKGEGFEVYLNSLKLESSMLTGQNEYIEFSGFFRMAPLTSTIELPQGETFDLLGATEEEYYGIISEIYGNISGLLNGLYQ